MTAEEAETASKLQEEWRCLEATVKALSHEMQQAKRQQEASAQFKSLLRSNLDAGQRLESLLNDKEEVSALSSVMRSRSSREQEAVAENKSQLESRTAIKLQAIECKLCIKKGELSQAKLVRSKDSVVKHRRRAAVLEPATDFLGERHVPPSFSAWCVSEFVKSHGSLIADKSTLSSVFISWLRLRYVTIFGFIDPIGTDIKFPAAFKASAVDLFHQWA
ncbi:hypothetical protein HPB47_023886 [Ixodes persulcatus]|uniref:Uncharacterized protein n=1 Tax=Ixodes persulcatus TaxID=34615 RepID=A0AC60Q890_IXOPE|nr:hypothetical protein HPB47_023886 [Ixodes persulcatus]